MGKTVIEELVVSLGLDAKALNESKAVEAINTIRQSVTLLNGELKEAEKSFAALGKIKMGSGVPRQSRPKKASDQDMIGMLGFPRPKDRVTQDDKKPIKVETVTSPKEKSEDKRKDKTPTSLKSMLTGMGGVVGTLAAGAYLFKSVAQGISTVYDSVTQFLSLGQQAKNTAEAIGLTAEQMSAFGSVAKAMGKDSETVISDIDKFGKEYASIIPGQFHQGLANMGIVPFDEKGNIRPYEEILKEVFDYIKSSEGDKVYKKRVLRENLGFSEGTAEMAMMGWDKFQNVHKGLVRSGLSPSEEQLQKESKLNKIKAITGMKTSMIGRDISDRLSDELVNAFSAMMGTEGLSEGFEKYLQMKPDELRSALKNAKIPNSSRQKIMDFMNIPYEEQRVNVPMTGPYAGHLDGKPENMIINLSVHSDKAKADASINGKPLNNVRVNLSPNHTGQ